MLTPTVMGEISINIALRFPLTTVRIIIIKTKSNQYWKGCSERGALYTTGFKVNWYSHYGSQCVNSFKKNQNKTKTESTTTIGSDIPLLGIYSKDYKSTEMYVYPFLMLHNSQ